MTAAQAMVPPMPNAPARALALPVTWLIIASVVIVSVLGLIFKPMRNALMLNPYLVRHRGHVHRLLTAGWVHGSVTHLAFNMVSLYFFGDEVLKVLGPAIFLALYVSAAVLAFVPTTLRHMGDPRYNSLGASGAAAAVMFSAILLNPKLKIYVLLIPIPVPAVIFAVGYLIYSAWAARGEKDGINHDAHFAGAIYGVIFTYVFEPARVERAIKSLF
jgi:membrane associated rhomboid family serine protease